MKELDAMSKIEVKAILRADVIRAVLRAPQVENLSKNEIVEVVLGVALELVTGLSDELFIQQLGGAIPSETQQQDPNRRRQ
jgi:hypothetical protein